MTDGEDGFDASKSQAMVDHRFANFKQVSGVREEVIARFKKMIDKDPESVVTNLRQMLHHDISKD